MSPIAAAAKALVTKADADDDIMGDVTDDQWDTMLSSDHVVNGVTQRVGGPPGVLAHVALTAALDAVDLEAVLREHRIECTGLEGVTCRGCREKSWMSSHAFRAHQIDAIRAALLEGSPT